MQLKEIEAIVAEAAQRTGRHPNSIWAELRKEFHFPTKDKIRCKDIDGVIKRAGR